MIKITLPNGVTVTSEQAQIEIVKEEKIPTPAILPYSPHSTPFSGTDEIIKTLAEAGKPITAIKFIRESKGWGLKESKDYYDNTYRHLEPKLCHNQNNLTIAQTRDIFFDKYGHMVLDICVSTNNRLLGVKFIRVWKNILQYRAEQIYDEKL
jgi:hypothetical protein